MNKNLLKKILATAGLIILYRAGLLLIAPGLPADVLYSSIPQWGNALLDFTSKCTIFGKGISAYVGASAIVLIGAIFSTRLRNLLMGGAEEQGKLERIILAVTIGLLIVSAYGSMVYLYNIEVPDAGKWNDWRYQDLFAHKVLFMSAKVCGGLVVVFLARAVTRIGLVNGVIVFLLIESLTDIRAALFAFLENDTAANRVTPTDLFTAVLLVVLILVLSIVFLLAKKRVEIRDDQKSGGAASGDSFSFSINTAGAVPVEITAALITFLFVQMPNIIGIGFPLPDAWYYSLTAFFCILLGWLFSRMAFNPAGVIAGLKAFRFSLFKEDSGQDDEAFLMKIFKPAMVFTVVFVTLLGLSPLLFALILKSSSHPLYLFTGSFFLYLACIVIDIKKRFARSRKTESCNVPCVSFNTLLEAELFSSRLNEGGIESYVSHVRVLPVTGTSFYWEICTPSIPYFITHRSLGGGTVSVYVSPELRDDAVEVFQNYTMHEE